MPGWTPPPLPARWASPGRPVFVGRRRELATLEEVWSAVTHGARQLVFIGREPGAGKSRLLAEAATALHRHGATVLLGTCVADFGAPYQPYVKPIVALLPGLVHGQLTIPGTAGPDAAGTALKRLVDRLRTLVGRREPGEAGEPEREYRRELYDAAAVAVMAAADQRPLVLALEDVHWASPASLQLLSHVIERTADSRVLVLATHRTTAPERSASLVHTIAHLHRLDGVRRLDLSGLDSEDIAQFLVREAGVTAHRARGWATILRDQTGGNPFFLRELWRDLSARGGPAAMRERSFQAPASVRDAMGGGRHFRGVPVADLPQHLDRPPGRRRNRQFDQLTVRPGQRHRAAGRLTVPQLSPGQWVGVPDLLGEQTAPAPHSEHRLELGAAVATGEYVVVAAFAGEQRPGAADAEVPPRPAAAVDPLAVPVDVVAVVGGAIRRTATEHRFDDGHRVGDTGVVWVPQVQPRQVEELHADQGGGLNSIDSGPPGWLPTPTRSPPGSPMRT